MYSMFKRVTVFALALLTFVMGVVVPYRRAEAATLFNNTISATNSCTVNSSGKLTATLAVVGINGRTSKISVELYVEKKILGLFWSRVDIGYPNNVWLDSTTSSYYNNTFNTNLPSNGTFRVTAIFTVSGTGGADDVITRTDTVIY